MMPYGKISAAQLVMTMVVSRIFTIITYTPVYTEQTEITAVFLGGVCSTLVLFCVSLPLFLLMRKTGEDVLTLSFRAGRGFGLAVCLFLFLGTMCSAVNTLVHFQFFMVNAVFANAGSLVFLVTMFLAALYAARMGLEGLVRVGTIFFLIVLFFLVTISVTLFDRIELLNLKPLLHDPWGSVFSIAWEDTARNMELILLLTLAPRVKGGKAGRVLFHYMLWSSVVLCVISFLVAAVLGEFAFRQTFPFYMISSVMDSRVIRRFDALHMVIWVLAAMLRLAAFLLTGNLLLRRMLPQRLAGWSLPVICALVLGSACLLSGSLESTNWIYEMIGSGWPVFGMAFFLPLFLLLFGRRKAPDADKRAAARPDGQEGS